ncbi:hypothetical protein RDI58_030576 [Solanum bulbocastanum]|uniref:Uncharacterized protein n=1 Tax=Solanum bulbocastanum TaxID=147425 RepID=A0AAN8SNN4_SOLBU
MKSVPRKTSSAPTYQPESAVARLNLKEVDTTAKGPDLRRQINFLLNLCLTLEILIYEAKLLMAPVTKLLSQQELNLQLLVVNSASMNLFPLYPLFSLQVGIFQHVSLLSPLLASPVLA